MSDPFSSRAELLRYVEAELKHSGLRDRPNLSVAFQDPRSIFDAPPSHPLWWTVESSKTDKSDHLISRHYLLEARYDERQFVIWFGRLIGFSGLSPRNVIRPAVHVIFPDSAFDPRPRTLQRKLTAIAHSLWTRPSLESAAATHGGKQGARPEEHRLGATIRWMLEHEDRPGAPWDPMVFPMSGGRY